MTDSLRTIHGFDGKAEYVLLPVNIYEALRMEIDTKISSSDDDYIPFRPEDYIKNPVALARFRAGVKQTELAKKLDVSQAYVSKIERDSYNVTESLLTRVKRALAECKH